MEILVLPLLLVGYCIFFVLHRMGGSEPQPESKPFDPDDLYR